MLSCHQLKIPIIYAVVSVSSRQISITTLLLKARIYVLLQFVSCLISVQVLRNLISKGNWWTPGHSNKVQRFLLRSNCPCCVRNFVLRRTSPTSLDLCVKYHHIYGMGSPMQFRTQHGKMNATEIRCNNTILISTAYMFTNCYSYTHPTSGHISPANIHTYTSV